MLVSKAIEMLLQMPQDAELHFCSRHDSMWETCEADDIYSGTTQYGILTANPKTVDIVVLDTGSCGI